MLLSRCCRPVPLSTDRSHSWLGSTPSRDFRWKSNKKSITWTKGWSVRSLPPSYNERHCIRQNDRLGRVTVTRAKARTHGHQCKWQSLFYCIFFVLVYMLFLSALFLQLTSRDKISTIYLFVHRSTFFCLQDTSFLLSLSSPLSVSLDY